MLARSFRCLSSAGLKKPSPFISPVSIDQLNSASSTESADQQVSVLLDELTRERLLVKSLRDEVEGMRNNMRLLEERESELKDLDETLREKNRLIESYKGKLTDHEHRYNQVKIDFENYKSLVEIEKVKLNQAKTLPIILSGIAGALGAYALMRGNAELEKHQSKYLKFELDQMWMSRLREVQNQVDELMTENDDLVKRVAEENLKNKKHSSSWISVAGRTIL